VQGGPGGDVFKVKDLPPFALTLVGGSGAANTLDYSAYTGDVVVNLALGTATRVAGGVRNIQNVTGSQGNDILVGDAGANVLRGGTGRNLIIGGAGADQVIGGGGDNILIAGGTRYDTDRNALQTIMAEWLSSDDFNTRVQKLSSNS